MSVIYNSSKPRSKKSTRRGAANRSSSHSPTKPKSKSTNYSVYHSFKKKFSTTRNPLSAFAILPAIKFENQDSKEKVLLLLRQDPILNFKWIVITLLLLISPAILPYFPIIKPLSSIYQSVIIAIWYLITFAYAFEQFLNWYFNVYIVTDEKIIDIDFNNLLYKNISEAKIDKIQDITYTQIGVIATIFHFGTVKIQTAAEQQEFEFKNVPNPERVTKVINDLIIEEEQEFYEGRVR